MLYPVIQYHPQDPTTIQHPAGLTMLLTNAIQSHLSRDEAAPPSFIPEALSALGYTLMGCGADGSLTQQLTQGIWRGSRYPVTPEFKEWILQGVPREGIGTVWDSLKAAAGPLGHGGKGSAKRAKSSGSAWAASAGPSSWGAQTAWAQPETSTAWQQGSSSSSSGWPATWQATPNRNPPANASGSWGEAPHQWGTDTDWQGRPWS